MLLMHTSHEQQCFGTYKSCNPPDSQLQFHLSAPSHSLCELLHPLQQVLRQALGPWRSKEEKPVYSTELPPDVAKCLQKPETK